MRFILSGLSLLFSSLLLAQTELTTQIHDIDMGQLNEEPIIFLKSGHVVTLSSKKHLAPLRIGVQKRSWFRLKLNQKRQITFLKKVNFPHLPIEEGVSFFPDDTYFYFPSILKDMETAKSFFQESRKDALQQSQCYHRAHIWTYEWRKNHQLYSSKVWLFFTRKFIRKYKFEWWFHVAPLIHVVHEGKVRERVMDMKYARGPLQLKAWTDIFMQDNAFCPVVTKYSDQADFPESGSCFVMKSTMYYYQPIDLEYLETENLIKPRWYETEVKQAYKEAFDVTL
jgi:hypothetical protein